MTEGIPAGTQEHTSWTTLQSPPSRPRPTRGRRCSATRSRAARDTRRFALTLLLRRRITVRQYRIWCRDARADLRAVKREVRRPERRRPRRYS